MDHKAPTNPASWPFRIAFCAGFGPAAYLSYIAAQPAGGSWGMAHPVVFYKHFSPMMRAGVS
jgi:hypothetical protein